MPDANEHEQATLDAIASAEEGRPNQPEAQVYATVAVAQALLALRAELSGVRDELQSFKIRAT